jgi:hypothetical protein
LTAAFSPNRPCTRATPESALRTISAASSESWDVSGAASLRQTSQRPQPSSVSASSAR